MERTTEMARSKDVYAVLGLLCIDAAYRTEFFADTPDAAKMAAKKLVGSLTLDELAQIKGLAGIVDGGYIPNRAEHVRDLKTALSGVYSALKCPIFPCPTPDPWDA
jgi:hypothetical protein